MSQLIDVKLPDIGDFKDVPVIDILVKPGDTVQADAPLLTLESDKASMDVPAPSAGTIAEICVKLGDRVSEGSLVVRMQASTAVPPASPATRAADATGVAAPAAPSVVSGTVDIECELLVLGAGPGGYSAAFRGADLGMNTVVVERYATLGGVCLNVGCIPSKALLHVAAVTDEAQALAAHGVSFGPPAFDLDALRGWKDKVVGKLTGGLAGMAKARKVRVIRGVGSFDDAHTLRVEHTEGGGQDKTGSVQRIRFQRCIIAAGSQAVRLPFLPDDARIVDSTGALALTRIPKRMLVIGGGIIGLEMATVYSSLGSRIDVAEMGSLLMPGADRDLVKVWEKKNAHRFDHLMLDTRATRAEALPEGIRVDFEGKSAPAQAQLYDLVLVAVGRSPNGLKIGADRAGVNVNERGFIGVDSQMRTNQAHIFAIGDIVGQPMLAHKAVHEAHVAAEAAAGHKSHFDATVIPSVAYTDPEIAWVGLTEDEAKKQGRQVKVARFPWAASGRAIANGRDEGFTKQLYDETSHRIVGGAIVGTSAGDMIGEMALAIELGADACDIGKTIHPHPTLGESLGMAAEVAEGVCTDLPPQRNG